MESIDCFVIISESGISLLLIMQISGALSSNILYRCRRAAALTDGKYTAPLVCIYCLLLALLRGEKGWLKRNLTQSNVKENTCYVLLERADSCPGDYLHSRAGNNQIKSLPSRKKNFYELQLSLYFEKKTNEQIKKKFKFHSQCQHICAVELLLGHNPKTVKHF